MELFPSQPDLYLKIKRRREEQEEDYKEQEEVQRRLLFGSKASDSDRKASDHLIHTLQFTSNNEPTKIDHNQEHMESLDQDLRSNFMVRPIRGIPLHQNQILDHYYYSPTPPFFFSEVNGQHTNPSYSYNLHHRHHRQAQPQAQRLTAKRGVRAPRMRWTTTLHAHFVHAVQLLGGHESIVLFSLFPVLFSFLVNTISLSFLTNYCIRSQYMIIFMDFVLLNNIQEPLQNQYLS